MDFAAAYRRMLSLAERYDDKGAISLDVTGWRYSSGDRRLKWKVYSEKHGSFEAGDAESALASYESELERRAPADAPDTAIESVGEPALP
jgi:hypothetical protein